MIRGIIAEIGNNHFGSEAKAREMIKAAHESGADYIKLQAINPSVVKGSMDKSFYEKIALRRSAYENLISYGKMIGAKVFYSSFGLDIYHGELIKISGSQFKTFDYDRLSFMNLDKTIISIPNVSDDEIKEKREFINKMNVIYVSEYLPKDNVVDLSNISRYLKLLKKPIGYSDHSIGIDVCKTAIDDYGCQLIEKHFHMGEPIKWMGKTFRDCIHSCDPKQLSDLKKFYEESFR